MNSAGVQPSEERVTGSGVPQDDLGQAPLAPAGAGSQTHKQADRAEPIQANEEKSSPASSISGKSFWCRVRSGRPIFRLTIGRSGVLLVAVPVLFELLFVGFLSHLLQQSEMETQRQLRSKTIIAKANLVMKRAASVTMSAGAYAFGRDPFYAQEYQSVLELITSDLDELAVLVKDKPSQLQNLAKMKVLMAALKKRLSNFREMIDSTSPGDFIALLSSRKGLQNTRALVMAMGVEMDGFMEAERTVERHTPGAMQDNQRRIQAVLWGSVAASILVALLLAKFFTRSISSRVDVLTDNTKRLSRGEELNPLIEGTDEIAQLDCAFHEVVDHLTEVSRQKQELVAVVSHELKSPLSSVSGLLSLLEAGAFGELSDRGMQRIAGAEMDLARLMRLINDLLDIEKLEAGKLDMLSREVSLDGVIQRALNSVHPFAEVNDIDIEVSKTSLCVLGDEDRLVQVLVNFLSNAIKYSNKGASVGITCIETGREVEVQVTDTGRGIPAVFREAVFERYTQVRREDATKKGGSGLGLYVCKKIIEQLGGSIGVVSEEERGSTFWFRLPQAQLASR